MDVYAWMLDVLAQYAVYAYVIILVLSFFESFAFVGILIPGSVAVIAGGLLVAQGVLDVYWLFVVASVGAILGDSFSYYMGRHGLITFHEDNKIFKPGLFLRGKAYFKKHGDKSVFFGRFIGWVRPVIPFVAGVFHHDRKIFIFWNALSGILWAVSHIAIGYFFGHSIERVGGWLFYSITLLTVLVFFKEYLVNKGFGFSIGKGFYRRSGDED